MQLPPLPEMDDIRIREFWLSSFILPTLTVSDELGVFDLLEHGALDEPAVARKSQLNPKATGILLAALKSLDLLAERNNMLELTDLSRHYLLRSSPYYWGPMLQWVKGLPLSHAQLLHALQSSGGLVSDVWDREKLGTEQAGIISAAMSSFSMVPALGLAKQLDLSGIGAVLDIGGGAGSYSLAMAQSNRNVRFDIADLPDVCVQAREKIAHFNMQSSVGTMEFNMFLDEWPRNYDAFFFANILHIWEEERYTYLLNKSFNALPAGGKIIVVEMLTNDTADGPLVACLFSMNMVLHAKGKQFCGSELTQLLESAGFVDVKIQKLVSGYSLIEARKPS